MSTSSPEKIWVLQVEVSNSIIVLCYVVYLLLIYGMSSILKLEVI